MSDIKHKLIFVISAIFLFGVLSPTYAKTIERPSVLDDRGPLTKITFIHYKRANAKPPWAGGGSVDSSSKCYSFLANGAKWKTVEDYKVNPNDSGLSQDFLRNAVLNGANQWDDYSQKDVFRILSFDSNAYYNESVDEENTISFGPYPDSNVIAVTNVWGYFYGPPKTRELVEWDMLLNTGSDWVWGNADNNPLLMDVENIVAHELGHAAGMGHPDSSCIDETMYAYSTEGETKKRDLNAGDIAGIKELYK